MTVEQLIIVLAILAISISGFLIRARKGVKRSLSDIKKTIEDLQGRGFNGGTLEIAHCKSQKFIQFRKYKLNGQVGGVVLGFPCLEWSKYYYSNIKKMCEDEKIPFRELESEIKFLEIDFSHNIETAFFVASKILTEIFQLSEHEKYYIRLEGAATDRR